MRPLRPLRLLSVSVLGLALAAGITAAASTAASASHHSATPSTPSAYCTSTGGKVVVLHYYDSAGVGFGFPGRLCEYTGKTPHDPTGTALVDLNTLYATHPTLGAAAYYAKPKPGDPGNLSPAAAYCKQLHALPTLYGYWATSRNADQSGLCRFADGSYLEEWTLTYNASAAGPRGIDLTKVLRWKPKPG